MKKILKYLLQQSGLFYAIRYGKAGRWYDHLFRKDAAIQQQREAVFYQSFLPSCNLIFDIGANDGHKTIVFEQLASKVIACDPDPTNQTILRHRFKGNKKVTIQPVALSNNDGTTVFYIDKPGSPLNTINPNWINILENNNNNRWPEAIQFSGKKITVKTVTLDTLIQQLGKPDFIKVDVEGNEKNVLFGLLQPVPVISFEILLPEFYNDAVDCIQHLSHLDPDYLFNYAVDEQLQMQHFIDAAAMKNVLQQLTIPHLEIIARTSASNAIL